MTKKKLKFFEEEKIRDMKGM